MLKDTFSHSQTGLRARQCDCTHKQNQKQNKECGHPDFIEFLNTAFHAADDDNGVERHEYGGKQDSCPGESCRAIRLKAEHGVKVAGGIAVDCGSFQYVAEDIAQHPTADMIIIAGNDKSAGNADPADPCTASVTELVERAHDIRLARAAYGELGQHQWNTKENHDQ